MLLRSIETYIKENTFLGFGNPTLFSMYGVFSFIFPFVIWDFGDLNINLVAATHAVGVMLCVIVYLFQEGSLIEGRTFLFIWAFSLFYCLPLLSSFMLINNSNSLGWISHFVVSTFLFSLLVRWHTYLVFSILAMLLSFIVSDGDFSLLKLDSISVVIYIYVTSLMISVTFSRNREKQEKQKIENAETMAHIIAHEIRTPLSEINAYLEKIIDTYAVLVGTYKEAKAKNVLVEELEDGQIQSVEKMTKQLLLTSNKVFHFMNMYLNNLKTSGTLFTTNEGGTMISKVVEMAINNYPLTEKEKSNLVYSTPTSDFKIKMDEHIVEKIIHNVIRNSLLSILRKGGGQIHFRCIKLKNSDYNELRILDNGMGIEKKDIAKVFDKYYTTDFKGLGIGLFFCKNIMEKHGGKIDCRSFPSKYAEFILSFPKCL
jgi:signal transduction histidine kinase